MCLTVKLICSFLFLLKKNYTEIHSFIRFCMVVVLDSVVEVCVPVYFPHQPTHASVINLFLLKQNSPTNTLGVEYAAFIDTFSVLIVCM